MEAIKTLREAINSHPFPPAGVKVSADLWKELEAAGLIQKRLLKGNMPQGFTFNAFGNDVAIEVDPSLRDFTFDLSQYPR